MSLVDKKCMLEAEEFAFKQTMEKVNKAGDEISCEMMDFAHMYFVATTMLTPDYFDLDVFFTGLLKLIEKNEKCENQVERAARKLAFFEVLQLFYENFNNGAKSNEK
jgi:hypothetical protein